MILITGGRVLCPRSGIDGQFDVVIDHDRIQAIEKSGSVPRAKAQKVIDAKGLLVTPGLVDIHVHFREPGYEWKETVESGSEAAIWGGVTSVACMPNTKPTIDTAEVAHFVIAQARKAARAHVYPIGSITKGQQGKELSPMPELADAGCVAFSDDGDPVWDANIMRRALEWSQTVGRPLTLHEEVKELAKGGAMNDSPLARKLGLKGIPHASEDICIARDIELVRMVGGHIHICHVSSARAVEIIRRGKADGVKVTAEVCPHHFTLTEEAVREYDTNAKMAPPLRYQEDVDALIAGLRDGTIDCIATDHAPHDLDSKRVEFAKAANGILGLQTMLPLTLALVRKGQLTLPRAIEAMTAAPAEIFNLPAGVLKKGAIADVSIIDQDHRWKFDASSIKSKSFNSPFLGQEMIGAAVTVIVAGNVLIENGVRT